MRILPQTMAVAMYRRIAFERKMKEMSGRWNGEKERRVAKWG